MFNNIITMAGIGKRFKDFGYDIPKFMIDVKGKTLFEWSMESLLSLKNEKFYFITLKDSNAKDLIRNKCLKLDIKTYDILELDCLTSGQAETAKYAVQLCNPNDEILIYNIDTYVNAKYLTKNKFIGDGNIPCFKAPGEHWSFVKLNNNNVATEVREKQRISEYASVGAYYFHEVKDYLIAFNEFYIKNNYLEKGEMYVAPLYNELIKNGKEIRIIEIPKNDVIVLGTPKEIEDFKNIQ